MLFPVGSFDKNAAKKGVVGDTKDLLIDRGNLHLEVCPGLVEVHKPLLSLDFGVTQEGVHFPSQIDLILIAFDDRDEVALGMLPNEGTSVIFSAENRECSTTVIIGLSGICWSSSMKWS